MKPIAFFVQALLWMSVACSPILVSFVIAVWAVYVGLVSSPMSGLGILLFGALVGVVWAERIRKTIGLSQFWGRLLGHPEFIRRSRSE
ncbi:hypothetical protein [Paraferrimonas sedimenticola]|uniref:Uncharacterized protein n=1 Tax=Paraferrimonas sedimenticola TaxID=375674 RepID=A0AA37RT07_9GAMM|nr:hypothetical protein [Paraferrimonas sedimenticola]GLP95131.1 hypothetical protein GCM10007895_04370 [Paraferrimonas sedimenticola]